MEARGDDDDDDDAREDVDDDNDLHMLPGCSQSHPGELFVCGINWWRRLKQTNK